MSKICTRCKVDKIEGEFYTVKDTLFSWCKDCCLIHRKKYKTYNKNYMQAYRKTDRGIQVRKEWVEKNREHIREYDRLNYAKNKDKHIMYIKRRKNRIKYGTKGTHTLEEWEDLKYTYEYKCFVCGLKEPRIKLTKDHITPISKDGTDDIINIMPLCRSCNCKKGTKDENWSIREIIKNRLVKKQFED